MHWHDWYKLFVEQIKETTLLQWIVVFLGAAEVLLARVNNVWLYPIGILGTILGVYLLFDVRLYADCALNVYYIVMSFYGWYYWIKKSDKPAVEITWSSRNEWYITLAISLVGTVFLYYCLTVFLFVFPGYKPSNVPLWDAWVSATAWAGMWLLAKRKIENWIFLNISNIFAIPLLFFKQLPLLAALTVFFFVIGTWGFFDWKRFYNEKRKADLL